MQTEMAGAPSLDRSKSKFSLEEECNIQIFKLFFPCSYAISDIQWKTEMEKYKNGIKIKKKNNTFRNISTEIQVFEVSRMEFLKSVI